MFCADEKADGERIDKLTGLCRDALSEGKILPLYGLFLSEALVEKDYVDHAVDLLDALGDRRLNPVERAMVKRILIKGLCGIDFKLGRMRIAPRFEKFRIMFSYKAQNVDVDYAFRFWDGIEINGLKYNNLDYADLNGYNRDIRIRL